MKFGSKPCRYDPSHRDALSSVNGNYSGNNNLGNMSHPPTHNPHLYSRSVVNNHSQSDVNFNESSTPSSNNYALFHCSGSGRESMVSNNNVLSTDPSGTVVANQTHHHHSAKVSSRGPTNNDRILIGTSNNYFPNNTSGTHSAVNGMHCGNNDSNNNSYNYASFHNPHRCLSDNNEHHPQAQDNQSRHLETEESYSSLYGDTELDQDHSGFKSEVSTVIFMYLMLGCIRVCTHYTRILQITHILKIL